MWTTIKAFTMMLKCWCAVASFCWMVNANVYMHNPRGSNNRGCETNDNRNNPFRLFDAQSDAAGGYSCPNAWPFRCYILEDEAERELCNQQNADQNYDDISSLTMADAGGVLHPNGTRTPKMYFYEGSILRLEWTQQQGCSDSEGTHCTVIIQYACEDTLTDTSGGPRDGIPITNSKTDRGFANYNAISGGSTNVFRIPRDTEASATIPLSTDFSAQVDPRFGRHETLDYYLKCLRRERNRGLWTAYQNVRDDATGTRQNQGGTRFGLECPEERDYYPYWGPSPWRDIAILTDNTELCPTFIAESQNTKPKYECLCPTCHAQSILVPINSTGCTAVGGTWTTVSSYNSADPYCGPAPISSKNHLGGATGSGKPTLTFDWTIPSDLVERTTCILRIRYNVTSGDKIAGMAYSQASADQNGVVSGIPDRNFNESTVYLSFADTANPAARLGLNIDTSQWSRVFQDRSWSFEIRKPPSSGECFNRTIYNLNVRGRRGNLRQTFPALDYDYAPNDFTVTENDCIHVQWTGSDYNPAKDLNDAFGGPPDPNDLNTGRSDRHNLVQITSPDVNLPIASLANEFNMFQTSQERKFNLAFIGQPLDDPSQCVAIDTILALSTAAKLDISNPAYTDNAQNYLLDMADRERYWKNCGKLSGAKTPYFDGGLFQPGSIGAYYFLDTRNSMFAIRRVQGTMRVVDSTPQTVTSVPTSGSQSTSSDPSMAATIVVALAMALI